MDGVELRRRALAGLADTVLLLGVPILLPAALIGAVLYRHRRREGEDAHGERAPSGRSGAPRRRPGRWERLGQSERAQAAILGAASGTSLALRNWQSPGSRLLGIRRVDARTGGPVTLGSTIRANAFDRMSMGITTALFGGRAAASRARLATLEAELSELRQRFLDDPRGQQQAVQDFYAAHGVNPYTGCWWQLIGGTAWNLLLARGTRDGRTLRDRLSGTVVIATGGDMADPADD